MNLIVDTSFLIWNVDALRVSGQAYPSTGLLNRIVQKVGWGAPALVTYEVMHVIHRKRRMALAGAISRRHEIREGLLGAIERYDPDSATRQLAAEICERTGCSAYDAQFLAQAISRGRSMLTADEGMASHAAALKIPVYFLPKDLLKLERDFPE
jgi:predicted nucleic acid-binding protein